MISVVDHQTRTANDRELPQTASVPAQANFIGYNDVVASALTAPSVGGTPQWLC